VVKTHSKAPRGIVALGAAAVVAVYAAGFVRTRSAAARWVPDTPGLRRPAAPSVAAVIAAPAMSANLPIQPGVAPAHPSAKPARPIVKKAASAVTVGASTPSTSSSLSALAGSPVASPSTVVSPLTTPASDFGMTAVAAKASPTGDVASPVSPKSPYRDGSYSGWGSSRHGDIEATVVIEDGRIASAKITRCLTRYSCSWIAHLPGQVVSRQGADVDYVSGATQSTDAFYYAVVDALSKAKG
jgi:uncharacterized protein with FMN-binding domain